MKHYKITTLSMAIIFALTALATAAGSEYDETITRDTITTGGEVYALEFKKGAKIETYYYQGIRNDELRLKHIEYLALPINNKNQVTIKTSGLSDKPGVNLLITVAEDSDDITVKKTR